MGYKQCSDVLMIHGLYNAQHITVRAGIKIRHHLLLFLLEMPCAMCMPFNTVEPAESAFIIEHIMISQFVLSFFI